MKRRYGICVINISNVLITIRHGLSSVGGVRKYNLRQVHMRIRVISSNTAIIQSTHVFLICVVARAAFVIPLHGAHTPGIFIHQPGFDCCKYFNSCMYFALNVDNLIVIIIACNFLSHLEIITNVKIKMIKYDQRQNPNEYLTRLTRDIYCYFCIVY